VAPQLSERACCEPAAQLGPRAEAGSPGVRVACHRFGAVTRQRPQRLTRFQAIRCPNCRLSGPVPNLLANPLLLPHSRMARRLWRTPLLLQSRSHRLQPHRERSMHQHRHRRHCRQHRHRPTTASHRSDGGGVALHRFAGSFLAPEEGPQAQMSSSNPNWFRCRSTMMPPPAWRLRLLGGPSCCARPPRNRRLYPTWGRSLSELLMRRAPTRSAGSPPERRGAPGGSPSARSIDTSYGPARARGRGPRRARKA
jgi:hypothetical protein